MSAVIDITPRLNLGRIGGSSVLPIMQLYHPQAFGSAPSYSSAFDIWATIDAKRHGLEMKSTQTRSMKTGKRLERVLFDWAADEYGAESKAWSDQSIDVPGREWQRITPDGWWTRAGKPELVDVKKLGAFVDRHGVSGTDQAEAYETLQMMTYLEALEYMRSPLFPRFERGRIVVFSMSSEQFKDYHVTYDPEFGREIAACCERFWREHVLPRKPPPSSGSELVREYVEAVHGDELDPYRDATDEEQEMAIRAIEHEVLAEDLRDKLALSIGSARGVKLDGGVIHYGNRSESVSVDWRKVAEHVAPSAGVLDEASRMYTKKRAGGRSLTIRLDK
ncbi:MAG: hypothetical protein IPG93_24625 [Burkholderiales bacterium]|nr:hypothetical protein [Burkholderiales bacterium]